MGVLPVRKTLLHFFQAVDFSQTPVILPLLRLLRNVAKSHSYSPVMLSYKYYINSVPSTVSKHTATVLSCYRIIITLTQSHVSSVNTQLQSCHVIV